VVNSALGKTSANITLTPDGMATLYAQWKGVLVCVRVCERERETQERCIHANFFSCMFQCL
jgi:hypothetical protein